MKALSDKRIAAALQKLYANPEVNWTFEQMVGEVHMSRTAYAKHFTELVGQPMFEYLTTLRMQRARELLQDTKLPLYELTSWAGYESDLAFTKTFKKHVGTTPTRYWKGTG
jgi:AraC-like DNA-binding protein